jgi:formamidopyrimidine-DNA glycosylase
MTPKEQLNNLAAFLLAPKEEVDIQLSYDEIASILSNVKQSLDELEALKKHNEPKKVVFNEKDTTYIGCADCPSCGSTIDKETLTGVTSFCQHCGQAVDW